MAWTDQCKFEAVRQIDHQIEKGATVRKALKAVSEESDIPAGTLKRWKYPESKPVPKNGNKSKSTSTDVPPTPEVEPTAAPVEEPVQNHEYKEALKAMEKAVRVARNDKWENTSKESILKDIEALRNIVDPKKKQTKRQIALQEDFWNADHVISERAAFHIKNSNIGDQMRNGDKIFTVPRIIDIEGSRSFLSVRVVAERNLKGARAQ